MFCLTQRQYRRWLRLEAEERRTAEAEAELQGYLDAITAAERQVRRWVVTYLRGRQGRRRSAPDGVVKAEIYRAMARRVPDVWGLRMAARLSGRYHGGDEPCRKMRAFAGKMLILDEALLALCTSGRVEVVNDAAGATVFRWCSAGKALRGRRAVGGARPSTSRRDDPSLAATGRLGLRAFLASQGAFVGFDE
jgi:hypothetical protein